jgi:hypothetical protein
MKLLLLVSLLVLTAVSPVFAEEIYLSDGGDWAACAMLVPPFQVSTVYVVHTLSPGATGSAWKLDYTAPANLVALGSSFAPFSVTGDPYAGIAIDYGACTPGTFVIGQLTYFKTTMDEIPGCNHLVVVAAPGKASVLATACDAGDRAISGGFFSFDTAAIPPVRNSAAPLAKAGGYCYVCISATEPTTWGSVKALYR